MSQVGHHILVMILADLRNAMSCDKAEVQQASRNTINISFVFMMLLNSFAFPQEDEIPVYTEVIIKLMNNEKIPEWEMAVKAILEELLPEFSIRNKPEEEENWVAMRIRQNGVSDFKKY
ncbi:hypothetical protein TNCV_1101261 [Trichonephila clavipes]|nr:hypothetical protein TNCV_1101261 [Trichonephila clavipes]